VSSIGFAFELHVPAREETGWLFLFLLLLSFFIVHNPRMALEQAAKAVDVLYEFRDRYFDTHDISLAPQREKDVQAKIKETLIVLEPLLGESFLRVVDLPGLCQSPARPLSHPPFFLFLGQKRLGVGACTVLLVVWLGMDVFMCLASLLTTQAAEPRNAQLLYHKGRALNAAAAYSKEASVTCAISPARGTLAQRTPCQPTQTRILQVSPSARLRRRFLALSNSIQI
jgi:hypothetical protein